MTDDDQERRLEARIRDLEERQRRQGENIAALEDRTAGQRQRLAALELGIGQINLTIGRIEDRQDARHQRIVELERQLREKPEAKSNGAWADIPLKILIGAMLVGMALGKAGFDPIAWLK